MNTDFTLESKEGRTNIRAEIAKRVDRLNPIDWIWENMESFLTIQVEWAEVETKIREMMQQRYRRTKDIRIDQLKPLRFSFILLKRDTKETVAKGCGVLKKMEMDMERTKKEILYQIVEMMRTPGYLFSVTEGWKNE